MCRSPKPLAAFALLAGTLLLAACAESKPSRFYVMTPLAAKSTPAPEGIAIGVGPVVVPQYLDRPQIVTRSSGNRLALAEFDQWGGRLIDNVTRVLAENLAGLLSTDRISIYPWQDASALVDQVTVDITEFERDATGTVTLGAFWSITDVATGKITLTRRSTISRTVAPSAAGDAAAYEATVAAMSEALASLSQEIADAIKSLKGG